MTSPRFWREACDGLAARDPILGAIIAARPGVRLRSRGTPFVTLARSIVGQQISVKAAQSIWERIGKLASGYDAGTLAGAPIVALRGCGLSERKAIYLRGLAHGFDSGKIDAMAWRRAPDESVIADLVALHGIGRWTAEMFLMFCLMRPDVLPVGDLGLQRAISLAYRRGRSVSAQTMHRIAEPWRPWRTVATWYLWRSLEPVPVEY